MRYQIQARDWDKELQARFGKPDQGCELTDREVIEAIVEFGRASILNVQPSGEPGSDEYRELIFENTYD